VYRRHFGGPRRERLFLSSLGFFMSFSVARTIAYSIYKEVGPLRSVYIAGTHVHHLVFGILLLLIVGYLWLVQVGTGMNSASRWPSRITAVLYGVGAALTLDEFALWLNLADVYWTGEGRESVDAIVLFGALLSVGLWGAPFFRGVAHEVARLFDINERVGRITGLKLLELGEESPRARHALAGTGHDAFHRQLE
jgi:hypothetical protein